MSVAVEKNSTNASQSTIIDATTEKVLTISRWSSAGPGTTDSFANLVQRCGFEANEIGISRCFPADTNSRRRVESLIKTFQERTGGVVTTDSRPVFISAETATWRARVFASDAQSLDPKHLVAELTETHAVQGAGSDERHAVSVRALPTTTVSQGNVSPNYERLERVSAAALDIIAEKGFAGASIREIASHAGIPIPTLYLSIRKKEDLLVFLSSRYLGTMTTELGQIAAEEGPICRLLERAVKQYLDYCDDHRRLINVVYREAKWLPEDARKKIFDLDRAFVAEWKSILVRGQRSGEFVEIDPALAADFIYFLCTTWALRHWILAPAGEEKVKSSLTAFILNAMHAPHLPARRSRRPQTH